MAVEKVHDQLKEKKEELQASKTNTTDAIVELNLLKQDFHEIKKEVKGNSDLKVAINEEKDSFESKITQLKDENEIYTEKIIVE